MAKSAQSVVMHAAPQRMPTITSAHLRDHEGAANPDCQGNRTAARLCRTRMIFKLALGAVVLVLILLQVSYNRTRLSEADKRAAQAVGQEAIDALLVGDSERWEAMIAPDEGASYQEAMRRHLGEMERSLQPCRGVDVATSVSQPLNGHDFVTFHTRFAQPCVDKGIQHLCTIIGLTIRRVNGRWYIDTVERGICRETP